MRKLAYRFGVVAVIAAIGSAFAENRTVAEGSIDVNGDAKLEVVKIMFVGGRAVNESCAEGEILVGRFAIQVQLGNGKAVRTDLNSLVGKTDLRFFPGPEPLHFFELTHDGRPSFGLAEVSCGNNSFYRFFALSPDGNAVLLGFTPPPDGLYILGNDTSPGPEMLRPTATGFECDSYENADGKGYTNAFRWLPEHNIFMHVTSK